MIWKPRHPPDEELLLAADHELSLRRLRRVQRHLAGCPRCRTRTTAIERTLAEALRLSRNESSPPLPPLPQSRARLMRGLADASARLDRTPTPRALLHLGARFTYAIGVLAMVVIIALVCAPSGPRFSLAPQTPAGVFLLPNRDLTPGATRDVTVDDVCGADRGMHTRGMHTQPVPAAIHRAIFESYGADYRRAAEYELDYLITPELGGVADARNLWPQPFSRTEWNAFVKDELELLFHRLVCDGEIDLATAQREMASDWIAAYKRFFNTDKPLRDYTQAPLTALDADLLASELEELGVAVPRDADGALLLSLFEASRQGSLERLAAASSP